MFHYSLGKWSHKANDLLSYSSSAFQAFLFSGVHRILFIGRILNYWIVLHSINIGLIYEFNLGARVSYSPN